MGTTQDLLSSFVEREANRHINTVEEAARILPMLDKPLLINGRLSASGVGGLALSNPVEVTPLIRIPDPTNESHVGRFAYGFQMVEGYRDDNSKIPMGPKRLLEIRQNGLFGVNLSKFRDHRARPAYYRALALFPGFFVNLTGEISEAEQPPGNLGPEIYLAYGIMSRLIDARDEGVTDSDGRVDTKYLFRRTVNFPGLASARAS